MFIALLSFMLPVGVFAVLPAWLLMDQYNVAVAAAYFSISLTLLALFWEAREMNDRAKKAALRRRQATYEREQRHQSAGGSSLSPP